MKSSIRRLTGQRVLAMLLAGAAWSALPAAHAAAGDAGTRDYAAEDKLLGGPSSYAGYADPYGQAPNANGNGAKNGAKAGTATTSAETMMNNNADPAQTNASFVKPGTVVMKRGARVQDANGKIVATPDTAAQSVYGANGVKVARKPMEIYKSPY
ncbi:hypothetical protein [Burkholderia sp. PAMC 26561]|uniref:hypothetical protein n=1 Tax=Burkholderia sp. PAMC 26561 TaxID=1795043 RepID=UPI0013C4509B|nr:hypothetical protein [Burkholderia sp. PAMC 26561]